MERDTGKVPNGTQLDLLLLAVLADGAAHGYAIIGGLRARSGGTLDLAEGTVYPALHRLEREHLIRARWTTVSGRRRKVYELSAKGKRELVSRAERWRDLSRAIDGVLRGVEWAI
jgi:DNA-binding PadR family transcriptional regulator